MTGAVVYQAVNLINGKRYIGVTSRSLVERASAHWSARNRKSGFLMPRAMKKYGRDAFRFRTLATCATIKDALALEIRLIEAWRPEYNLSGGGDGMAGCIISKKQRKDRSRRLKQHGAKVWEACAAAHRKSVICLKDGKIFPSGKDAAAYYKITPGAITMHLKGKTATAAGRLFAFYTGIETADPAHDDRVAQIRRTQRANMVANTPRRAVVCMTTGARYGSLGETSQQTGVPYGVLARILGRRGLKSWRGLKFGYAP